MITWDETKRRTNIRKHGIDLAELEEVFDFHMVTDEDDRERYEAGLKRLRRADRQAILASIELGYSYDQIALVLNKPSAEAARLAVRRALLRLGEEMARVA